jgi:hypothetical protein
MILDGVLTVYLNRMLCPRGTFYGPGRYSNKVYLPVNPVKKGLVVINILIA